MADLIPLAKAIFKSVSEATFLIWLAISELKTPLSPFYVVHVFQVPVIPWPFKFGLTTM